MQLNDIVVDQFISHIVMSKSDSKAMRHCVTEVVLCCQVSAVSDTTPSVGGWASSGPLLGQGHVRTCSAAYNGEAGNAQTNKITTGVNNQN